MKLQSTRTLLETIRAPELPGLDGWRDRARCLQARRLGTLPMLTLEEGAIWAGADLVEVLKVVPTCRLSKQRRFWRFFPEDIAAYARGVREFRRAPPRSAESAIVAGARKLHPQASEKEGVVYFIEAVHADRIKIGFTTKDPRERLQSLQTAAPFELRLVASFRGSYGIELYLHRKYSRWRILPTAEWFTYSEDIQSLIHFIQAERRWP